MFIDDSFKWDKLTIVCYSTGFGGDFFCNLLQMNYDSNYTFSSDKNNKFGWVYKDSHEHGQKILIKKTETIFKYYKAIKNNYEDRFLIEQINWNHKSALKIIKKIMNIIYDEDLNTFKQNYINFVRNVTYEEYLEEKYIINTHFVEVLNFIDIRDIFPGSLIINLFVEKNEYALLNLLLGRIKNLQEKKTLIKRVLEVDIEKYKPQDNLYNNMIGIDVGKLFFEDGYEDEAENILSGKLNREIKLDREKIKKYKKDNMNLLAKTFNITDTGLTPEKLLKNILKKHIEQDDNV
jgi:hypothetical protein